MTKRKREAMPSIDRVRASHHRQMVLLVGIKMELDRLMEDYTLAHDAGLSALRSGTGKLGTRSSGSDTTAQADYEFHRMQGACAYAAGLILEGERDLRKGEQHLERAGAAILNAWLDTDPEIGAERRAKRRAATQVDVVAHADGSIEGPAAPSGSTVVIHHESQERREL